MKPKNIKERRNSFLKFLLLFVATIAMILIAVFFTFKIPVKENEILKDQAGRIEKELKFQDTFSKSMTRVKRMIDSLDVPGQNISYQNSLISSKLVEMQKIIPRKDSTFKYDMYSGVVGLYVEIQKNKNRLRELKDAESIIEEYKEALEKSKTEYKQLERDLMIARQK
ncbi:type VI secretion system TssO [Tenacibaculum sp.]|nr:type VI secretion system TssO [Tenacibaculum sp.]